MQIRHALGLALTLSLGAVASPAYALGDGVLWYTGNSGYTSGTYTTLETVLTSAGATTFDVSSTWPSDLSAYRLVFLVMSTHLYSSTAVATMQSFVADGGTLVLLQDSAGGEVGAINTLNRLAGDLGLTSVFAVDALDDGCTSVGTVVVADAFTSCVDEVIYSDSADITVGAAGEALITGESSQTLVAVEGGVVFLSDLALVMDTCTLEVGNKNLIRNLYKGADGASVDGDCDGYDPESAGGTDCDDTNPDVNPGAPDICDEIDNNCDGEVDNDLSYGSTFYEDKDGDGYGINGDTTVACSAPVGYADNRLDCNDFDATVYPTAPELCDAIDNDCDTTVDEDPSDGPTWYADQDGDGYGGTDYTVVACENPGTYLADGSDCDDTKVQVNPGATEYCDGLDDNCDGEIDNNAANILTFYADADGDGYGDPSVSTMACEAPDGYISDATDCDDSDAASYPGADGWSADCVPVAAGGGSDTGAAKGTGCGCATPGEDGGASGWWALIGLAGLWRRRRASSCRAGKVGA